MFSARVIVDAFGGIATRAQILEAGLAGTDITREVRLGTLRRVRRAWYASPQATRDAVLAVRVGGRLCGLSAARSHGLWGGFDDRLHVGVRPNASRLRLLTAGDSVTPDISERQVVVHWLAGEQHREEWRVSAPDAVRQVVRWCDRETALACLDTAMDVLGWSRDHLIRIFENEPASSRRRAADARPGSGSGYESIVVRRLAARGLRIRQQVVLPGVGRVDALVEEHLVLEVDGYAHHGGRAGFEEDRRRDAAAAARGRPVIRLSTARIREDWPGCLADIEAALPFSGIGVAGGAGVRIGGAPAPPATSAP